MPYVWIQEGDENLSNGVQHEEHGSTRSEGIHGQCTVREYMRVHQEVCTNEWVDIQTVFSTLSLLTPDQVFPMFTRLSNVRKRCHIVLMFSRQSDVRKSGNVVPMFTRHSDVRKRGHVPLFTRQSGVIKAGHVVLMFTRHSDVRKAGHVVPMFTRLSIHQKDWSCRPNNHVAVRRQKGWSCCPSFYTAVRRQKVSSRYRNVPAAVRRQKAIRNNKLPPIMVESLRSHSISHSRRWMRIRTKRRNWAQCDNQSDLNL